MSKIFYDHLLVLEEITAVLDSHSISVAEKKEILSFVDQTMHHHVLDTILTNLPQEHHQTFLTRFHKAPHDQNLLTFLKANTSVDIEKEIAKEVKKVKKEILQLIKKNKR